MKNIFSLFAIILMLTISGYSQNNKTFHKQGSTIITGDLIVVGNFETGLGSNINWANPWLTPGTPFFISNASGNTVTSTGGNIISTLSTGNLLPAVTATSTVGSNTYKYLAGYITTLNSTTGNITTVASTTVGATTANTTTENVTNLVASALPSFTIACGTVQIPNALAADTAGAAVLGITTSSIIIASYAPTTYALAHLASDTAATAMCLHNGWVTCSGKHNRFVNYWVPKK